MTRTLADHYYTKARQPELLARLLRLLVVRMRTREVRRLRTQPQPATTPEELLWLTKHFA